VVALAIEAASAAVAEQLSETRKRNNKTHARKSRVYVRDLQNEGYPKRDVFDDDLSLLNWTLQ